MENHRSEIKKRIKSRAAFTLAEALVATLIMLMVSSVMVAGIPAARRAYENVVKVSNAELLMSTTISALRNELGMASNIEIQSDYSITYYNSTYGTMSKILKHTVASDATNDPDPAGTIMLQRNAGANVDGIGGDDITIPEGDAEKYEPKRLVSKAASNEDLYVTYDTVLITGNVITFVDLQVKDKTDRVLAPQGRTETEGKVNTSIRLMAN